GVAAKHEERQRRLGQGVGRQIVADAGLLHLVAGGDLDGVFAVVLLVERGLHRQPPLVALFATRERVDLVAVGVANLGLHFTKAGVAASDYDVKAGMLHAEAEGAGLLVYAGGDENKKTGDVLAEEAIDGYADGEVGVAYVVSKGNAYTANDNVFYNDPESFAEMAFSFQLMPFDNEEKEGTYAVDPNTIIVRTSSTVASPYPDAEDKEEATETIEGWFAVHEVLDEDTYSEDPLEIERVDFAANDTLSDFVVILADGHELDNTKDYELFFDLGLDEGNVEASIELDLDREAPVLNFISPSAIVGEEPDDRVIDVEWGKPFDQSLFPRFRVEDNRDGDLTAFVYVPKGDYSVLDTREEGDYTILLRVEDEWGNVTDETFIFRVSKTE
ncbi:MAG: hypothetical protein ACLFTZ_06295, partial [Acholeplasmataceae bacterium]